ncbi:MULTISPECIES: nuclear transport factor 2 family protein [unclassified Streptomyces]|uniref:nuclear transport factor 2 family protein n=1 Tax=unclassified Streptomyces TaxID=2593676 RepID=UPI0007F98E92|nr:nuclear transport factor 2 family protein [Streptomyces sp. SAT1]ANO42144.1 hypothetical protein A8713_033335 [Streptomyces sp. SAT1]
MSAQGAIDELLAAEHRLQAAHRRCDVREMDAILDNRSVRVDPEGTLVPKAQDLASFRDGLLVIDKLEEVEPAQVIVEGGTGITRALLTVMGSYAGHEYVTRLRYTRTWVRTGEGWRVLAIHASQVAA